MRSKSLPKIYIGLFIFLYFWSLLSKQTAEQIRLVYVASIAPSWSFFSSWGRFFCSKNHLLHPKDMQKNEQRLSQLELENTLLKNELEKLANYFVSEQNVLSQVELVKKCQKIDSLDPQLAAKLERKLQHVVSKITSELIAMPAQVIYRDPACWGTTVWINVGEEDNQVLGYTVIAKNSPVVIGSNLVGVIDFVGKKQSKVRLITDPAISPSVCVSRGAFNDFDTEKALNLLIEKLKNEEKSETITVLQKLKEKYATYKTLSFHAKGQLQGSGSNFCRSLHSSLKGIGFNLDFPEGDFTSLNSPIIKKGDLLVTTGLDGVFPKDLTIGIVCKVNPPKSGGFVYNVEILPHVDVTKDLQYLYVLAPRQD